MNREITNKKCPDCKGIRPDFDDEVCYTCNGTGTIFIPLEDSYDD